MPIERDRIIIGLTGPLGSGATLISKYLAKRHGFHAYSLSDIVRREAAEPWLHALQETGNRLRKERGAAFLAIETIRQIEQDNPAGPIVVDSIRNPAEVQDFRKFSNFYLLSVVSPQEIRWQRIRRKAEGDEGYPKAREEFERIERKDRKDDEEHGQQVSICVDMSDFAVSNKENYPEIRAFRTNPLFERVDRYINLINHPGETEPTWDEVFMSQAYSMSYKSTCLRRRTGAVIVNRHNQIVASGYNRSPEGLKSCKERGGCYRREMGYASGEGLDACRAIHAEQDALLQLPGRRTIGPDGGTLYCTTFPCLGCAKGIISSGIRKIVFLESYPDAASRAMLDEAGITVEEFEGVKIQAFHKLFRRWD